MTIQRMIELLEIEHECMLRGAHDDCDRDCANCELVQDDGDLHEMYLDVIALLKEQKAELSDWVSVEERMPVELHSIFWPWYGKKQWSNAMWREQSDKVLVTVVFKDGTRLVTTGETHDGKWNTSISRTLEHTVTHWMQFPELPREENE